MPWTERKDVQRALGEAVNVHAFDSLAFLGFVPAVHVVFPFSYFRDVRGVQYVVISLLAA